MCGGEGDSEMLGGEEKRKANAGAERQGKCNNQPVEHVSIYLSSEGVDGGFENTGRRGEEEKRRRRGKTSMPHIVTNEIVT